MVLMSQIAITSLRANDIPTDPAIQTTAVMTGAVTLPTASYPTPERRNDFFRRLDERLAARREMTAISRATVLPGAGGVPLRRVEVEGRALPDNEPPRFMVIDVAPSYFSTLALALLQGRDFQSADWNSGNDAVIVNQRFVDTTLDGANPIGMRIAIAASKRPAQRASGMANHRRRGADYPPTGRWRRSTNTDSCTFR